MAIDRALDTGGDDGDPTPGRISRIIETEREARPVIGAEELERTAQVDGDIGQGTTSGVTVKAASFRDEGARSGDAGLTSRVEVTENGSDQAEESIIEVADDEIEAISPDELRLEATPSGRARSSTGSVAPPDVTATRPTQRSPMAPSALRSRPPERPSVRARTSVVPGFGSSSLPPPRTSLGARGTASSSPPVSAGSADPWLLANRTLELSRAQARIAELEEQLAYRDARITDLEERLEQLQLQLSEFGSSPRPAAVAPRASAAARNPGAPLASSVDRDTTAVVSKISPTVSARAGSEPRPETSQPTAAGALERGSAKAASDDAGDEGGDAHNHARAASNGAQRADAGAPAQDPADGDDLRQIAGIGPRFEAALRKQGITRLSQIAAWSEDDVRQVAKALKIPKSRIVKGRWVEGAREVMGARAASE